MNPQLAYDFAPIGGLLLLGALVASGPLLWLWLRHRGASPVRRLQALTLLTLFLTFDLTLFGAYTRLSDSGLGCPDWPGCYGNASPVGAKHEIAMAQAAQPTGPVTHRKAWIEMLHRYLATGVGAAIVVLLVATMVERRRQRRERGPLAADPQLRPDAQSRQDRHILQHRQHRQVQAAIGAGAGAAGTPPALHPGWPLATLIWVCLQGAFGALTVTHRLAPAIVTAHLLGAIVLLVLLCIQAVRYRQAAERRAPIVVSFGLRALLLGTAALLLLQIALGGWVSSNYAVLACTQFPQCQNSWWPPMNFTQGFELWRGLGVTSAGAGIDFAALTAIHYAHRLLAYLVFAALGLVAWRLNRIDGLHAQSRWLAGLALLQLATGLGNVLLGWPLAAALLHTGGAAALALALTAALMETAAPAPTRARTPAYRAQVAQ